MHRRNPVTGNCFHSKSIYEAQSRSKQEVRDQPSLSVTQFMRLAVMITSARVLLCWMICKISLVQLLSTMFLEAPTMHMLHVYIMYTFMHHIQ